MNLQEITIQATDFAEKNSNVFIDAVLDHRKKSNCKSGKWIIMVFGFDKLDKAKEVSENCLLKINMELNLVGESIDTILEDEVFKEDTTFKPSHMTYMGAILVYCK